MCVFGEIVNFNPFKSFLAGVVGNLSGPVYFLEFCPKARGGFATKFGMSIFMLPFGIIATICVIERKKKRKKKKKR